MLPVFVIECLILTFIIVGLLHILLNLTFPNWFFAIIVFFGFKWLFNYRKCTISYIEVKLRGVKKEEGYLYRFLNDIVDYRENPKMIFVYPLIAVFVLYHYSKTKFVIYKVF